MCRQPHAGKRSTSSWTGFRPGKSKRSTSFSEEWCRTLPKSPAVANDVSVLDDWHPSPDAPVVRNLSIAGTTVGDPDLAERSEEILQRG